MKIAFDCLKDNDRHRPSAQQLVKRVALLKGSPEYLESASRQVQEHQQLTTTSPRESREMAEVLMTKEEEIQQQLDVSNDLMGDGLLCIYNVCV